MATVEKKLKTLDVYLLYDGEKVTISDTADDNKATRALNEFKKYETMHYETEENGQKVTNAIPYHAVEHIEATESGGGGDCEVWYTGTLGECDGDVVMTELTPTEIADTEELINNYINHSVKVNDTILPYFNDVSGVFMNDISSAEATMVFIASSNTIGVVCPTDMKEVEVSVCDGSTAPSDMWEANASYLPKGSVDYPIGRYKRNDDYTWAYEGEPTGVVVQHERLLEVYEDAGTMKARSSMYACTSWENATVDEALRSVRFNNQDCQL